MSRDVFLMDEVTQVIYLLFTKLLDQITRGIVENELNRLKKRRTFKKRGLN